MMSVVDMSMMDAVDEALDLLAGLLLIEEPELATMIVNRMHYEDRASNFIVQANILEMIAQELRSKDL